MQRLSHDQYARLLETEQVILTAASSREQIHIHKGFLALHSAFFAKVIDKPSAINEGGQTEFEIHSAATAIKIFVRWCYEGHFHPIDVVKTNEAQLNQRKIHLIDLWILGETYEIAAIQNEAIDQLAQILTVHPHLLTKEDVEYTLVRTTAADAPLRHLVVMITVVMMEVNAHVKAKAAASARSFKTEHGDEDSGIAAYEKYAHSFPGFMSLVHKWQRAWLILQGMSRGDTTKLPDSVADQKVHKFLLVEETAPSEWVLSICGASPKIGFKKEEIIVIDD